MIVIVIAALTFLPALLGALGRRVNKGRMPWHRRTAETADVNAHPFGPLGPRDRPPPVAVRAV